MASWTMDLLCQQEQVKINFFCPEDSWLAVLPGFFSLVHTAVITRGMFVYKDFLLYRLPQFSSWKRPADSPVLMVRAMYL